MFISHDLKKAKPKKQRSINTILNAYGDLDNKIMSDADITEILEKTEK